MTIDDVQRLAPTLFIILFIIVAVHALVFLSYSLQDKENRLTKQMLAYWGIQTFALIISPIFIDGTLEMLVPFTFNIFTIYYFYKGLFADYGEVSSYRPYFIIVLGIAWPLAIILDRMGTNFTWTTMPMAIALTLPLWKMIGLVIFDKERRFRTIHHKWALVGLFAGAVHCINFSLFRNDPLNLIWGTTTHIIIVVIFGVVIANFHNYMLGRTENLRLEKLVEKRTAELRDKLELVSQLRERNDNLFKIVIHDISNPISAILGYLALLGPSRKNIEEEKRIEYLERANLCAETIASIIRQIRAMALVEKDQAHGKSSICLKDSFDVIEKIFHPQFEKKGVILSVAKPKEKISLRGNKELFIHSVLGNLISNGLKFSEEGATVSLACDSTQTGNVIIVVKDQGIGIENDIIKNMFSFKTSNSTPGTKGEKGLGFGMPLLKNYLDKNNGRVEIVSKRKENSSKDHGTTVSLFFEHG